VWPHKTGHLVHKTGDHAGFIFTLWEFVHPAYDLYHFITDDDGISYRWSLPKIYAASANIARVLEDLNFIRDQTTTTEVNIPWNECCV